MAYTLSQLADPAIWESISPTDQQLYKQQMSREEYRFWSGALEEGLRRRAIEEEKQAAEANRPPGVGEQIGVGSASIFAGGAAGGLGTYFANQIATSGAPTVATTTAAAAPAAIPAAATTAAPAAIPAAAAAPGVPSGVSASLEGATQSGAQTGAETASSGTSILGPAAGLVAGGLQTYNNYNQLKDDPSAAAGAELGAKDPKNWPTYGSVSNYMDATPGFFGAIQNSALATPLQFLPGAPFLLAGAGQLMDTFGSGKDEGQQKRDALRSVWQDAGIIDENYNFNTASGTNFDAGADGSVRNYEIDPTRLGDLASEDAMLAGAIDPLSYMTSGYDRDLGSQGTGLIFSGLEQSKDKYGDLKAKYDQIGGRDVVYNSIKDAVTKGLLSKEEGDAQLASIDRVYNVVNPTDARVDFSVGQDEEQKKKTEEQTGIFQDWKEQGLDFAQNFTDWRNPYEKPAATSTNIFELDDAAKRPAVTQPGNKAPSFAKTQQKKPSGLMFLGSL